MRKRAYSQGAANTPGVNAVTRGFTRSTTKRQKREPEFNPALTPQTADQASSFLSNDWAEANMNTAQKEIAAELLAQRLVESLDQSYRQPQNEVKTDSKTMAKNWAPRKEDTGSTGSPFQQAFKFTKTLSERQVRNNLIKLQAAAISKASTDPRVGMNIQRGHYDDILGSSKKLLTQVRKAQSEVSTVKTLAQTQRENILGIAIQDSLVTNKTRRSFRYFERDFTTRSFQITNRGAVYSFFGSSAETGPIENNPPSIQLGNNLTDYEGREMPINSVEIQGYVVNPSILLFAPVDFKMLLCTWDLPEVPILTSANWNGYNKNLAAKGTFSNALSSHVQILDSMEISLEANNTVVPFKFYVNTSDSGFKVTLNNDGGVDNPPFASESFNVFVVFFSSVDTPGVVPFVNFTTKVRFEVDSLITNYWTRG